MITIDVTIVMATFILMFLAFTMTYFAMTKLFEPITRLEQLCVEYAYKLMKFSGITAMSVILLCSIFLITPIIHIEFGSYILTIVAIVT